MCIRDSCIAEDLIKLTESFSKSVNLLGHSMGGKAAMVASISRPEVFKKLGFKSESETFRMYRGYQPPVSMNDVYGLACLELG